MSYSIEITSYFEKQLKKLSKKYPSIKNDFGNLLIELKVDPTSGVEIFLKLL